MSILVTGGAGFIGSHLCRLLISEGYSVRSLDIKESRNPVAGVEYVLGDVRNLEDLKRAMRGVSAVYHYAAIVNVADCQDRPAESYSTNFMGTINVLEAVKEEGVRAGELPRLIFAGSSAVYGSIGQKGIAIAESQTSPSPLSFYAGQKLASEQAINLYYQRYAIPSVIFRFFNVYGSGQDPTSPYSGVITIFSKLAREGANLSLHGGGYQTRDFISVKDLVRANLAALKLEKRACSAVVINLGTSSTVTIRELGEMILNLYRGTGRLVEVPPRNGDVPHSRADITRATEILKWSPQSQLEQGLTELKS